MGCYGNGASLDKIATIAVVGHSIVDGICHYVIMDIQRSNLHIEYMKWSKREAKDVVKLWVKNEVNLLI